jgi:hypothetical protein
MKIAITGHSAGIGQALAKQYEQRGHEIVGLSRRNGYNIRSLPKVADQIEPCDWFINNAQSGYAQTELLFEMARRWHNVKDKYIINISTMMTVNPTVDHESLLEYQNQKKALELAHWSIGHNQDWPQMTLVKPGEVLTGDHSGPRACNVDVWAEKVVDTLESIDPTLKVYELSLGVNYANES